MMDIDTAALYLGVMGNVTRLKIIRLLVRAGDGGLAVGNIQRKLNIPGSTLSHHLSHLRNARLIHQEREATVLRCCVHYDRIEDIVHFLTEQCCTDPELQMETFEKESV